MGNIRTWTARHIWKIMDHKNGSYKSKASQRVPFTIRQKRFGNRKDWGRRAR